MSEHEMGDAEAAGGSPRVGDDEHQEERPDPEVEEAYVAYDEVEPYVVHMAEAWTMERRIVVAVPESWAEYKSGDKLAERLRVLVDSGTVWRTNSLAEKSSLG